jgi:hypothetical protein
MYDLEKQLELINLQVDSIRMQTKILCEMLGIDPTPIPEELPRYTPQEPTIDELTDPDA